MICRLASVCLSLALAGCGQIGFDLVANEPDAGDDAGIPRDPRTVTITSPLNIEVAGAAGLQDGFIVAHNDDAAMTGAVTYVPEPAGSAWSEEVVAGGPVLLRGTDTYRDIAVTVGGGGARDNGLVIESDSSGVTSVAGYDDPVNHFRGVNVDREGWAAGRSFGLPHQALLVVDDAWSGGSPAGFDLDLGGTSSWLQDVVVTYEVIYVVGEVLPSGLTVVAAIKRDTRAALWATGLTLTQFAKLTRHGSQLIVTDVNHIVTMSNEGAVLSVQRFDDAFEGIASVGEFADAIWFSGARDGTGVFGTAAGERTYALDGHGRGYLARNDRGWVVLAARLGSPTIDLMPLDEAGDLACGATTTTVAVSTHMAAPTDLTFAVTPRAVTTAPLSTVSVDVTESLGCPGGGG